MKVRGIMVAMMVLIMPLFFGIPSAGSAQDQDESDCPYSECSLRLKKGFWGRSVVRGDQEQKVIGLGFWVGNLDAVFEGSPRAIELGASFRRRHNLGGLVALTGLAAMTAGFRRGDGNPFSGENDEGVGLVVSGALLTIVGGIVSGSGDDALLKGIWEYNRTLVGSSSTGDDAR